VLSPGGALAGPSLVVQVALAAQTTVLLPSTGQTAQLTVLVHRVADPVGTSVLEGTSTNRGSDTTSVELPARRPTTHSSNDNAMRQLRCATFAIAYWYFLSIDFVTVPNTPAWQLCNVFIPLKHVTTQTPTAECMKGCNVRCTQAISMSHVITCSALCPPIPNAQLIPDSAP
jgi:hypothetical protein